MAFFQVTCMTFFFHISATIAVKYKFRYGQRLLHMIEIWPNGYGDPHAFILLIIWLISAQFGGLLTNVFLGGVKDDTQDGIRNFLFELAHLKDFLENSQQVVLSNVGRPSVAFSKQCLTQLQKLKRIHETDGFLSIFNCFNSFFSRCFVKS